MRHVGSRLALRLSSIRRPSPTRAELLASAVCRAGAWLGALLLIAALAGAEEPIVARVGTRDIDTAELERRARRVAPAQWAALGASWPERRRRFLEEVLVAEALLDHEAAEQTSELGSPRSAALARAVLMDRATASLKTAPSAGDIESYRARHAEHYEVPEAILIWRILLRDRAEAEKQIAALGEPSVTEFGRIARERSLDVATSMRGGNLGYVAADGQTHRPQVRVSKALFEAAIKVRDGELVKEPVAEGDMFAVVWRRAHRPRAIAAPDASAREIAVRLREAKLADDTAALITRLRAAELRDHHPELVAEFEPVFAAPVTRQRVLQAPAVPAAESRPKPTDRGLR